MRTQSVFHDRANSSMPSAMTMYTSHNVSTPCSIVWFELEPLTQNWGVRKIEDINLQDNDNERVVDCLMFKKNVMLIVMRSRIVIMREDLVTLGTVDFKHTLGKDAVVLFCKPDKSDNTNGLLLGFFAGETLSESPKFNLNSNSYDGRNPGYNTLVARYSFNINKR